nr:MAG TPA: hypothetical protein [Caudoviricetes sp.]
MNKSAPTKFKNSIYEKLHLRNGKNYCRNSPLFLFIYIFCGGCTKWKRNL